MLIPSPSLEQFRQIILSETSLLIEEVWDSAKAALIGEIAKASKKNILILQAAADERFLSDLPFFDLPFFEFPSWETLPGEEIPPSSDIVGKRLQILHALARGKERKLLVCSLQAALQKVPHPSLLQKKCALWKKGDAIPFSSVADFLVSIGYRKAPIASDKGEFAMRGGIVDIFPISSFDPVRIEFFGDVIDQIRTFDPVSQKSSGKIDAVFLAPASELELLKSDKKLATIFDYLSDETLVIFNNLLKIEDQWVSLKSLPGIKSSYFSSMDELLASAVKYQLVLFSDERAEELSEVKIDKKTGRAYYTGTAPLQPLSFQFLNTTLSTKRWSHPFIDIPSYFSSSENKAAATADEILHNISRHPALDLHFLAASEPESKALQERLHNTTLPKKTSFQIGYLSSGFVLQDSQFAIIPMTELTRRYQVRRQKWRSAHHTPASEFHELIPGDIVVHFHNGIAKFLGLEKRPNHLGTETEYMVLEYAEKSKLYVPITQAYLVSRYIGAKEEVPILNTLGSNRWQKTRVQAEKAILGYAKNLLERAAQRQVEGGYAFPPDSPEVRAFEEEFPFVETEDQLQAISDIKTDMMSPKATDRLVCGDVGYGKTEVAMRAAFKTAIDGKKQVAVLVPTTVLALQHYETFVDRMASFPVNIAHISRFRSSKEIKETLKKVEKGEIDILIGTHRLLSQDIRFKDLGLIIVDEEQRFGVRAKEHLKTFKTGVDCITLSATPIPRTLYMSLIGAREISTINTPPQDRLPIKTILAERDPPTIQNALLRELSRDGQAFFIHNRVESIFLVSEEIQKLLPAARVLTAHGQMSPDEIDTVFHAFKSGEGDILVATTIIENGIDIPNANTILIDRADQFGLADLYQLRGRVGRWNRPAYCYFLTPPGRSLSDLSRRRLHAMLETAGYGGGMKIAMRDLEIRGAGDILGTQQSGQVSAIGFHLYRKLLKRAIDGLGKKAAPILTETKMEFSYDANLPDLYINESSLRMEIYHRLGDATSLQEVDEILAEMKDRFGPPPAQVLWLYHLTRIRVYAAIHYFTLLKFEKLTLTAEQQKGKTVVRKTLVLPKTKSPKDLEEAVCELLKTR